jgi:hypothetical protein
MEAREDFLRQAPGIKAVVACRLARGAEGMVRATPWMTHSTDCQLVSVSFDVSSLVPTTTLWVSAVPRGSAPGVSRVVGGALRFELVPVLGAVARLDLGRCLVHLTPPIALE